MNIWIPEKTALGLTAGHIGERTGNINRRQFDTPLKPAAHSGV
ncbi:hypothetical protein [uncultured Sphingomonas sp.]|nr:hypothetical protein [uncultured Sphingomonas sp.]